MTFLATSVRKTINRPSAYSSSSKMTMTSSMATTIKFNAASRVRCIHSHLLRPIVTTPIDAINAERSFRVDASSLAGQHHDNHSHHHLLPPDTSDDRKSSSGGGSSSKVALKDDDGYLKFDTLHELAQNASLVYSANPLFGTYHCESSSTTASSSKGGGQFDWTTYANFGRDVSLVRSILQNELQITPYTKVGIISNNRHEWAILAAATYSLSAILVPMYESQLVKDWEYILNDSQCMALLCSSEAIYQRVRKVVIPNVPLLDSASVLCFDAPGNEPHSFLGAMSRARQQQQQQQKQDVNDNSSSSIIVAPTPDDIANLIYTSGTTGKPKGVELMHSNQVTNIKGCRDVAISKLDFPLSSDRSLAFLPWAHSYGQTTELWCLMSQGASMGICRGVSTILEDLKLVEPTLLFAVPALYKKVYDGVINGMNTASPLKQTLMRSALRLGKANAEYRNGLAVQQQQLQQQRSTNDGGNNSSISMPITTTQQSPSSLGFIDGIMHSFLDTIVLSKIRALFGGNLRAGFVAGAACPKEIIHFMDAIGIPICEGYGLTETSPVIAVNNLSRRKAGSVGQVINGVTVWIVDPANGQPVGVDEEGEICCSGPNVMKGYHNNPVATNEVITLAPDGKSRMFHTGDLGKLDKDGYVHVTGRLKELYKLENGKYVCPTPIEQAIGMSRFLSQVVVCGANRPYNIALIVPDWIAIRSELGLSKDGMSEEELVNDDTVKGLISAEIKLNCYSIKKFEIPAAFAFVAPFTSANGMITPKMSIRRHVVMKTYEELISDLYERRINRVGDLKGKDDLDAA